MNNWKTPTSFPTVPYGATIAVDTETYCEDLPGKGPQFITGKDFPIGISLAFKYYKQYFPIAHTQDNCEIKVVEWFQELLQRQDILMLGANTRFDLESLWKCGITPSCAIQDIQVVDALLDENQMAYKLDSIAQRRGFPGKNNAPMERWMIEHGLVAKGKPDYTRLREVPPSIVGPYAEMDAELTLKIYEKQMPEIIAQELTTVEKLERDLIPILWDMRLRGVLVDIARAEQLNKELSATLKEEFKQFPSNLDPWSSQSISKWISTTFNIATPQTDKGNDSIKNDWLIMTGIPELEALANWRQREKIRKDFIEGLVLENSYNHRVHPNWFQTRGSSFLSGNDVNGTRSGRIGCTDPNLTQIPIRHEVWGPIMRSLFLPEHGCSWAKADYSSQEPRITLHYAYLLKLPKAHEVRDMYLLNPTTDFHQVTTDMCNKYLETPITRRQGKDINLGLSYGMGRARLARKLGITFEQVESLLETYDKAVPFIRKLLKAAMQRAVTLGYVKTILGRRRRFEEYEPSKYSKEWVKPLPKQAAVAKWGYVRRAGCFRASNSIVQGSAAEQTKTALIEMYKLGIKPGLQVYDEISASVVSSGEAKIIKEIMENAIKFEVPHIVDIKIGSDWGNTKEKIT